MAPARKTSQQHHESKWQTQRKPGHRSTRGVAETSYGEVKRTSCFSLTPTAATNLKELSGELNISTSELLEQLARIRSTLKVLLEQGSEPLEP
jgi:hypothetical protein